MPQADLIQKYFEFSQEVELDDDQNIFEYLTEMRNRQDISEDDKIVEIDRQLESMVNMFILEMRDNEELL